MKRQFFFFKGGYSVDDFLDRVLLDLPRVGEYDDFTDQPDGEYLQPEDHKEDSDQEQGPIAESHIEKQSPGDKIARDCQSRDQYRRPRKTEEAQRFLGELDQEEHRQQVYQPPQIDRRGVSPQPFLLGRVTDVYLPDPEPLPVGQDRKESVNNTVQIN